MSSGPARRVSPKDIQVVQNLIERCLQLYMNQREVVETLLAQAKIEPGFTELVWQKLEEENREFFKAYYLRLTVKHQIMEFNKLLEQQVRLMRQMNSTAVSPMSNSNGSHITSMHQNSVGYAQADHAESALKAENLHHPFGTTMTNAFANGGSSMHANMVEMSAHANRMDAHPSMGLMGGMNGGLIKSEAGFSGNSPFMFGPDGSVMEAHPSIADASFSSESSSQALNEPLVDAETTFGFLGQIPRNFSLSDLTADYSQNDILNYTKSPYLTAENDFLDSRERELQGDNKRLDTISEGASYDNFGSD